MKILLGVLGLLIVILMIAVFVSKGIVTPQVAFILIFAVVGVGGWGLLKFIQKHY